MLQCSEGTTWPIHVRYIQLLKITDIDYCIVNGFYKH